MATQAEYTTRWDMICKMVDAELVKSLNEKFDEIAVALKLIDGEEIEIEDILIYFCDSNFRNEFVNTNRLIPFDEKLREINKVITDIMNDFHVKTEVRVSLDLDYNEWLEDKDSILKVVLIYEDIVELTPRAKKLMENGIMFELEKWHDESYW